MRDIILEIMKYCKAREEIPSTGLFIGVDKDIIVSLKDFITKIVEKYLNLPEYRYSLTQYKLYKINADGTKYTSYLENKNDDSKRTFEMKLMKKYKIDIVEIKIDGNYEINIS